MTESENRSDLEERINKHRIIKHRIIIIDDEPYLTASFKYLCELDHPEVEVLTFNDREHAKNFLDQHYKNRLNENEPPITVAILDVMMRQELNNLNPTIDKDINLQNKTNLDSFIKDIREKDDLIELIIFSAYDEEVIKKYVNLANLSKRKNTQFFGKKEDLNLPENIENIINKREDIQTLIDQVDERHRKYIKDYESRLVDTIEILTKARNHYNNANFSDAERLQKTAQFLLKDIILLSYPGVVTSYYNSNLLAIYQHPHNKSFYAITRTKNAKENNPGFSQYSFKAFQAITNFNNSKLVKDGKELPIPIIDPIYYTQNFLLMKAEYLYSIDNLFQSLNLNQEMKPKALQTIKKNFIEQILINDYKNLILNVETNSPDFPIMKLFYYAKFLQSTEKVIGQNDDIILPDKPLIDSDTNEYMRSKSLEINLYQQTPFWDLSHENISIRLNDFFKDINKEEYNKHLTFKKEDNQKLFNRFITENIDYINANPDEFSNILFNNRVHYDKEKTRMGVHPAHNPVQSIEHKENKFSKKIKAELYNLTYEIIKKKFNISEEQFTDHITFLNIYWKTRRIKYNEDYFNQLKDTLTEKKVTGELKLFNFPFDISSEQIENEVIQVLEPYNPFYYDIWKTAKPNLKARNTEIHTYVALKAAVEIQNEEGGNLDIIIPGTMLHDIGWSQLNETEIEASLDRKTDKKYKRFLRRKHETESVKLSYKILLSYNIDLEYINQIMEIIQTHDNGLINPHSLEARVVRDADKIWRVEGEGFYLDIYRMEQTPEERYNQILNQFNNEKILLYTNKGKDLFKQKLEERRIEYDIEKEFNTKLN